MKTSHEQVARRVFLDSTAVNVSAAASEAGIAVVLVKGPSTVRWLYPDSPREYSDIDLLVAPTDVPAISCVLRDRGFVPMFAGFRDGELAEHARVWKNDHDAVIDLHVSFAAIDTPPEAVWREICGSSEPMELVNGDVRVPSLRHRALIVALHAAQHEVSHDSSQSDLRRAVTQVPVGIWEGAVEAAERLRCVDAMTTGLYRSPEGIDLAHRLGLGPPGGLSSRLLSRTDGKLGRGLARLATGSGVQRRLAVLRSTLVPSPAWIRSRYPDSSLSMGYLRRYLALPRKIFE